MATRRGTAKTGMTLGFIGGAEIEEANAIPLLENLLADVEGDVKAIFPLTKDLFTDSMADIGNWLAEQDIPYEVVVDEAASKDKALKEWIDDAAKSHKVVEVASKLVDLLEAASEPRLVVLWNDDDGVSEDTTNLAAEKGVKALDLEQGLEEIELQEGDTPAGDPADDAPADEPGEDQPYTREELEAIEDLDVLKKICSENEIEIPARSRKGTYIDAILKAQDETGDEPESAGGDDEREVLEDEAPKGRERSSDPDVPTEGTVLLSDEDWDGLRELSEGIVEDVTKAVETKLDRIIDLIGTLGVNVDKLAARVMIQPSETIDVGSEEVPPSTGVRKRAAAPKEAAPKDEGGMSKEEAEKIIEEWGGKRGRPTAEVAEARAVLGLDQPQPKRPVGRPRKAAS